MKLETIKRNNKKNIIIGSMIVLSVVAGITLTATRAKYRSVQNIKLASGTVNYKASDLHIVAIKVNEDGTNYIDQTEIPIGDYTFNTTLSKCRIPDSSLTGENAPADESIPIEYRDGRVYIGVNKKNTKCYLYFDKIIPPEPTTSERTLAKLNITNINEWTPTFTSPAKTDEGIYKAEDSMYKVGEEKVYSYYWRGAATTNHVIFDNKCWRIVRINGDGSIRLIYNGPVQSGNTCHGNGSWDESVVLNGTAYNSVRNNHKYVGWTYTKDTNEQRPSESVPQTSGESATLKIVLENWYNNNANISAVAREKIVTGKFCNDRNTRNGETWIATGSTQFYAAYQRLIGDSTKSPTLSCPDGDVYELKVGIITADEVQFAGVSGTTSNSSYYLYNGQFYWTMSPYRADDISYVFIVCADGSLNWNDTGTTPGVRPVINLRSDVTFNEGSNGTETNPYIVE